MKTHRIRLAKSPYRMLMTDILPYERPLFFSNRFFARVMKHFEVKVEGDSLIAGKHKQEEGIGDFLKLLSGHSSVKRKGFRYHITKDGIDTGRELTVIHPFHQMEMMEFYSRFESLIIYYCGRSEFSLRHPCKVARELKGSLEYEHLISDDADPTLSQDLARNYFVYHKFSKIAQFYDSFFDLRLEKQFNFKAKIDVEKCFDSIDPSLLPDLLYNDGIESGHFMEAPDSKDFAYQFASLQSAFNPDEKGIVIGPEFSRIFAEIFLQQIEKRLEKRLEATDLRYPKDCRILRYVDDSFIYANSVDDIKQVLELYVEELGRVGLTLKTTKAKLYKAKPFIDEITVVKERLKEVIEQTFENRLLNFKGFIGVQEGRYDTPVVMSFKSFVAAMRSQLASVRREGDNNRQNENEWRNWTEEDRNVIYKDISSFLLGVINKNLRKLLKQFNDLYREYSQEKEYASLSDAGLRIKERYESGFIDFCIELTEALFFIFASDPRMPVSITIVQLLDIIQRFVRGKYVFSNKSKSVKFPAYLISRIDEKITDQTHQILRHKRIRNHSGLMECLNLLELQHIMFPRNRISREVAVHFLECVEGDQQDLYNFFTLFQLIHFAENKRGYKEILDFAIGRVKPLIARFIETKGSDTESLLTVLELLSDSYISAHYPELLAELEKSDFAISWESVKIFLEGRKDLFISSSYSVGEELRFHKCEEVY